MNKSRRHHYIPIFFSKNFTKNNGKLNLYDKQTKKVFEANPRNIFLENDRNTFLNKENSQDDVIEKIYAKLDLQFSRALKRVLDTGKLTGPDHKMLLFMAYTMKWRVPQYDQSYNDVNECFSFSDLGLGIKIEDKVLDVDFESLFDSEAEKELKRLIISIQPFRFKNDLRKIVENSFLIWTPYPGLIGDCPFNESQLTSDEIFEDFVFPISPDLTLIYSKRIDREKFIHFIQNGKNVDKFLKAFSVSRDLSTLSLSGRFAGCNDIDYLNEIIQAFENEILNQDLKENLSSSVFTILYSYLEFD